MWTVLTGAQSSGEGASTLMVPVLHILWLGYAYSLPVEIGMGDEKGRGIELDPKTLMWANCVALGEVPSRCAIVSSLRK